LSGKVAIEVGGFKGEKKGGEEKGRELARETTKKKK